MGLRIRMPVPREAEGRPAGIAVVGPHRRREIQDLHDGLRSRDHFEILGISRAATADEVKDAYFRLARPYHPDAPLDASLEDLRDKRSAVFIRLGEAYETLRSATSRIACSSSTTRIVSPRPCCIVGASADTATTALFLGCLPPRSARCGPSAEKMSPSLVVGGCGSRTRSADFAGRRCRLRDPELRISIS